MRNHLVQLSLGMRLLMTYLEVIVINQSITLMSPAGNAAQYVAENQHTADVTPLSREQVYKF